MSMKESPLYQSIHGKKGNLFLSIVCYLLIVIVTLFVGLKLYIVRCFGGVNVDGESMLVTLQDGDKLLAKLTSKGAEADYGDIIVVYVGGYDEWQHSSTEYIIKRLIAKEGDSIKSQDGQLYLQKDSEGEWSPLDEPYAYWSKDKTLYEDFSYTVGEGEIFFLGDNRFNSTDSRYAQIFGSQLRDKLYKESDIWGVVPSWALTFQDAVEWLFLRDA